MRETQQEQTVSCHPLRVILHAIPQAGVDFLDEVKIPGGKYMAGEIRANASKDDKPKIISKYKIVSVDHLAELQEDIDRLRHEGKLSQQITYREYIDYLRFEIPEGLPEAKAIIIMATFTPLMAVNFYWNGKIHQPYLPPQYYQDGVTEDDLRSIIQKEIIPQPGYKLERERRAHLKLLAVRSGLGRYGRNNICYVDGMGSFLTLYAFWSDYPIAADDWGEIRMLDACKRCRICMHTCIWKLRKSFFNRSLPVISPKAQYLALPSGARVLCKPPRIPCRMGACGAWQSQMPQRGCYGLRP